MLLSVAVAVAEDAPPRLPSEGYNLAKGRPCTFSTAPNYSYCKDADDAKQLTDSLYNGCVWTDKGTVGWGVRRNRVVFIDIDLGEECPIGKITFDSITGSAQVTFPSAVLVFLSSDGERYRCLGDVMTETPVQTSLLNHRFVADGLKGWGRYVRMALLPGGFYIFCDEIEIMRGDHRADEARYMDDESIPASEVAAYADRMKAWARQKNTTVVLLREASEALAERGKALGDERLIEDWLQQIAAERAKVLAAQSVLETDYREGPPYRSYDRHVYETVARANSKLWPDRAVVVWHKSPWAWLRPLDAPVGQELGARVRVDMMNNEWATASFVVTSCSDRDQELSLVATEFDGPEAVPADRILRIAHIVHVEAFGYNYRDDPIIPFGDGPVILKPGISKRIWLTFKTRGMDLKPGTYASSIKAMADGKEVAAVPVELRVWPLRFPDQVSLHSNSWGYFDDPCIAGHEEAAAQDLVDHYNTALTLNHRYLPKPKPDRDGNLREPLDFSKLDQMLAWNPECRLWLIWIGFEFGFRRMGLSEFGTPAWENAFTQYVTQMRDHLAEKGIGKSQFAWYWTDEPSGDHWEKYDHPASKLLKQIDPDMLVWANPTRRLTVEQFEASLPYVDIFCPSLGTLSNGAVLDICHRTRLKSWQYVCASEKNCDPFGYYRWFSWKAWKNQLGGIGMWVYADRNGQTFSDYLRGVSYAMVYKGRHSVIGSKRWDAWRQGIADYEYLRMLTDTLAAARERGVVGPAMAKAQRILTHGVDEVIGEDPHSGDRGKCDLPDQYRLQIFECLTELKELGQ